MKPCLHCNALTLVKTGRNPSGSQRYVCKTCQNVMTLEPQRNGYTPEVREHSIRLYLEGNGFRRIGRLLGGESSKRGQLGRGWGSTGAVFAPATGGLFGN